jgi:hypothetical protein
MRDSDMAIGGLVLLGIIGAFAYFLFPNFITGILRGPSYNDIVRAQEHEIATFNHETEVVFSYLTDSWTMKTYRRIERMVGRDAYENWIQQVKTERNILVRDTVRDIESQRQIADSLSRLIEESIRQDKESIFKLSKSPSIPRSRLYELDLIRKMAPLLRRFQPAPLERRSARNGSIAL